MMLYRSHILRLAALAVTAALVIAACDDKGAEPESTPNLPPEIPVNDTASGSPPDGSVDQPLDIELRWTCVDPDGDRLRYDVFFGQSPFPGQVGGNLTPTSFVPLLLGNDITYYWKVVAKDDNDHRTESPIWRFTTVSGAED